MRTAGHRVLLALSGSILLSSGSVVLAGSVPPAPADQIRATAYAAVAAPFNPRPISGRCGDPAGSWLGIRWTKPMTWRFNAASVPAYLAGAAPAGPTGPAGPAIQAVQAAAAAVSTGHNDCDLPADLAIEQRYLGVTTRRANIDPAGGCGRRDHHNVVSFGRLSPGLLAVTCVWWQQSRGDDRSVEADILVDQAGRSFFVQPPDNCRAQWDLEGVLTHEFGHLFGLGHVSYQRHGALTMSDALTECGTGYRRLGLGDLLVLQAHYRKR